MHMLDMHYACTYMKYMYCTCVTPFQLPMILIRMNIAISKEGIFYAKNHM